MNSPSRENVHSLVQQAERLFKQRKLEEALQFYREAGIAYHERGLPREAANCFSQAAQCEKIRTGLEPLLEAAQLNEMAAKEALHAKDYAFARWQFRQSGLLYEREGDFEKYSHCFVESQDALLQYLWDVFKSGKKQEGHKQTPAKASWADRIQALAAFLFGILSKTIWGYGEAPFKTVLTVILIIFVSAYLYTIGGPLAFGSVVRKAHYAEAFYLSGITFSTLGYGDITPLGWLRYVALLESLSGFVMIPMLVVALTRRYLRVYR